MSITTVLFDLDGTLLPMDQEEFTKGYLNLLVQKFAPLDNVCLMQYKKPDICIWNLLLLFYLTLTLNNHSKTN